MIFGQSSFSLFLCAFHSSNRPCSLYSFSLSTCALLLLFSCLPCPFSIFPPLPRIQLPSRLISEAISSLLGSLSQLSFEKCQASRKTKRIVQSADILFTYMQQFLIFLHLLFFFFFLIYASTFECVSLFVSCALGQLPAECSQRTNQTKDFSRKK